jgi:glyoxylase-like metal-dependent hydrolase (beta-lactamase superfamily II)
MLRFGMTAAEAKPRFECRAVGAATQSGGCDCCAFWGLSRRGFLGAAGAGATLAAFGMGQAFAQTAPAAPVREITQIAGNLYRFRNNNHFSVFLVTPQGIIATDPINADAAGWLKAQFKERFNQVARYVIYSHDHADHISGGEPFADTATFVAHENARKIIIGEKRPTPVPQITLTDRARIELGGAAVDLVYVGLNHSDNSLVMSFGEQKTLFTVDFIPIKAFAFRTLPDAYYHGWVDSLRKVEAMSYDIMAPGHGPLGKPADVTAFRTYLEELHAGVLAGARAGRTLEQLQAELTFEKYKDWAGYQEMRPLNIEGMYRLVQGNRRDNRGGSGPAPT